MPMTNTAISASPDLIHVAKLLWSIVQMPSTGSIISPCGLTSTAIAASPHAISYCSPRIDTMLSSVTKVITESLWPQTTVSNSIAGFSATISIATKAISGRLLRRTNAYTRIESAKSATIEGLSIMIR